MSIGPSEMIPEYMQELHQKRACVLEADLINRQKMQIHIAEQAVRRLLFLGLPEVLHVNQDAVGCSEYNA